ncbi:methyl-accepting chemotaxis protein [Anaerosporobacter sp.]|uniref:methyl-accepting chemotaxis protein n=1 Tax=Anaerosporobacter sp. TaxID=1872529 RepID=UPI00286F965E|nr:methyl-accepting chemotaxis protein [Anaerosporobacter sp.]
MKKNRSLKTTLAAICMLLSAVICIIIGSLGISFINSSTNNAYDKYETAMNEGYKKEIKSQVQSVLAILQAEYDKVQAGESTEAEAQKEGLEIIRNMRYRDDDSGYFWIDDMDYNLIMHPILPDQEGNNRFNLEDKNGIMIIQSVVTSCSSSEKGGFNEFYFTKADGVTVAPKIAYSGLFEPWNWAISTGNYVDDMDAEMKDVRSDINNDFKKMCAIMIACGVVMIIITAIVSIVTGTIIVKPLKRMQEFANYLSRGDLTKYIDVKQMDEIGLTATNLNSARENINKLVKDITSASDNISGALNEFDQSFSKMNHSIEEVSLAVNDISKNVNSQASSTSEASNDIKFLAHGIENTSKEATSLGTSSKTMRELSEQCSDKLKDLVVANTKTQQDVDSMFHQAKATNVAAENIRKAAELINAISAQTDLLSLNASIEAARAGESGKGFAVVANEIGSLAKQSAQAVEEISNIIENLMDNSEKSLSIMETINSTIDNQVKSLNDTQSIFSSLYSDLNLYMNSITTIESMTNKMDNDRQGVTSVLDTLNELAQSNAASTEETLAMTEELSGVVNSSTETVSLLKQDIDDLMERVKRFTVE